MKVMEVEPTSTILNHIWNHFLFWCFNFRIPKMRYIKKSGKRQTCSSRCKCQKYKMALISFNLIQIMDSLLNPFRQIGFWRIFVNSHLLLEIWVKVVTTLWPFLKAPNWGTLCQSLFWNMSKMAIYFDFTTNGSYRWTAALTIKVQFQNPKTISPELCHFVSIYYFMIQFLKLVFTLLERKTQFDFVKAAGL